MGTTDDVAATLLAMEREALDRWAAGDPGGFLAISARDVVYLDPFVERPIHGLEALTTYYEGLRGRVRIAAYEILEPRVQVVGAAAVLTFRFVSRGADGSESRWSCTEVYRHDAGGWRIVQTHWSQPQPRR